MMNRILSFFRSFQAKITLALVLSMFFIIVTSNFLIYEYSFRAQFQGLRSKLMVIAKAATLQMDSNAIRGVPLVGDGVNSPAYKALSRSLSKFMSVSPSITYTYVLAKTDKDGVFKFIVDVRSKAAKGDVAAALPGDEYDARNLPELIKALKAPSADTKLVTDKWGVSLSGYAPVTDADGDTIAILGIDVEANDVYRIQREVYRRVVIVLLIGVTLSLILGFAVSAMMAGPIKKLVEGTRQLSRGELDYKVEEKGGTEIEELAASFNKMSKDIKQHIEEMKRTTADRERLMRELEIARGIQQSFLPQALPYLKGFEVAAFNIPASVVGGDFYDFIPLEHGNWGLVVADVSGRGIPAAIFMALSRTLFNVTAKEKCSVSEVVEKANKVILENNKANMFVTLFYAVLDETKRTINYASAGHNPSLLMKEGEDSVHLLKAQGIPLGMFADNKMTSVEIKMSKGDVVVIYTDGISEAINFDREQFEVDRLAQVIRENRHLSAGVMLEKTSAAIKEFVGLEPQFDDMTLMILKAL
jgi:serine phosphatase RsbU (regulator of sigma subunit)